jgi:putative transposase
MTEVTGLRPVPGSEGTRLNDEAPLGLGIVVASREREYEVSFWQTYYHVVWGTKKREHITTDERVVLIRSSLSATALEHEAIVHAIGIMPDHVHMAISIPPKIAVAELIGRMKGASSRRVNMATGNHIEGFGWQPEYGVFSFSKRGLDEVVAYVENQPEIHAKRLMKPVYERSESPPNNS